MIFTNIAFYRRAKKLTQKQLANLLNVSRTSIAKWETGVAFPSTSLLPKIAETLHCSIDNLFDFHPDGVNTSAQTLLPQEQAVETPPRDGLERDLDDVLEW